MYVIIWIHFSSASQAWVFRTASSCSHGVFPGDRGWCRAQTAGISLYVSMKSNTFKTSISCMYWCWSESMYSDHNLPNQLECSVQQTKYGCLTAEEGSFKEHLSEGNLIHSCPKRWWSMPWIDLKLIKIPWKVFKGELSVIYMASHSTLFFPSFLHSLSHHHFHISMLPVVDSRQGGRRYTEKTPEKATFITTYNLSISCWWTTPLPHSHHDERALRRGEAPWDTA